jgi:hypothetical protein
MNVVKLIDRILANVDNAPNKNRIIGVINDSINKINLLIEPLDSIVTIANDDDTTWDSATITWDDSDVTWDSGRFTDWFSYSTTNNSLTAKNNRIQRIKRVYLDGIEQKQVSYEGIAASVYTGNEIAVVGKTVYFATDITAGSSGVIKMKLGISFPSVTGTEEGYNIPDYFEDLIYNEAVYIISNDPDQKQLAKALYNEGIQIAGIKTNIYEVRQ